MELVDPGWANLLWKIVVTVCGIGGGLIGMWARSNFVARSELAKAIKDITEAQQKQDERLAKIESEQKNAPKHSDLMTLSGQLSQLTGRVANMEGQAERNNNLLEAIHDHLLNTK